MDESKMDQKSKWIKMDQNKGKMGQNKGKMGQNKGKMNQNGSKWE